MTRNEFMNRLEQLLAALPAAERRDALDYYDEYLDAAGPQGKGGGVVVKRHPEQVTLFPARHPAELLDADTPNVLAELKTIFQNDPFYR